MDRSFDFFQLVSMARTERSGIRFLRFTINNKQPDHPVLKGTSMPKKMTKKSPGSRIQSPSDNPMSKEELYKFIIAGMDDLIQSAKAAGVSPVDVVSIAFTHAGKLIANVSEEEFLERLKTLQLVIDFSKVEESLVDLILPLMREEIRLLVALVGRDSRNGVKSRSIIPSPPVA
jgi:hypothetical protein